MAACTPDTHIFTTLIYAVTIGGFWYVNVWLGRVQMTHLSISNLFFSNNISLISLTDQLSPPDSTGPDTQCTSSINTSHPANIQKPPIPPAQSHPQASMQPPTVPPYSQSTGSLQFQSHVQPPGLNPITQTHVQVNVGPAHSHSLIPTEENNKEDVIFF